MLELFIANKNYSSWSMRPWIAMRETGIAFREVMVPFDDFGAESAFKQALRDLNPVGKVPVLRDGELLVWDSLAICETLAERHPDKGLWPADAAHRARARSLCAEMHAGFRALREACPMNIEASLPEAGAIVLRDRPALRTELARLDAMWSQCLREHGGPMLFGRFSIADAYYAPVCMRLLTYALPLSDAARAYVHRVAALASVREWCEAARQEHRFVVEDEPYRIDRAGPQAQAAG